MIYRWPITEGTGNPVQTTIQRALKSFVWTYSLEARIKLGRYSALHLMCEQSSPLFQSIQSSESREGTQAAPAAAAPGMCQLYRGRDAPSGARTYKRQRWGESPAVKR